MPHVSVHYRIYLGAGHHRQPRNSPAWVEPSGYSGDWDSPTGSPAQPPVFPTIPFSATQNATFAFWSVSDAEHGRTQSALHLVEPVGESDLTLVAWYFLPGGGGPGNTTGILIDAYSVAASDFIDDDFVDVTSDPSLTSQANVAGFVPTAVAETVDAYNAIGTEKFEGWIVSPDGATASGDVLTAPAESVGLAFATYAHHKLEVPGGKPPAKSVKILFGVTQDGGGVIIKPGGGGGPIGPWGPLIGRLLTAVNDAVNARRLPPAAAKKAQIRAAKAIGAAAKRLEALATKRAGG